MFFKIKFDIIFILKGFLGGDGMGEKILIAQVIVNNNSYHTDQIYDYRIPEPLLESVEIGMRVIVPFGRGNRRLEAYIMNIKTIEKSNHRLKEILFPIDNKAILDNKQIKMILWLKKRYLCKYMEAIQCLLPAGIINKEKKIISLLRTDWKKDIDKSWKNQIEILNILEDLGGKTTLEGLYNKTTIKNINPILNSLQEKDIIDIDYEITSRVRVQKQQYAVLNINYKDIDKVLIDLKNARKQKEIILFLKEHKESSVVELLQILNTTRSPLNALVNKDYVSIIEKEYNRDPFKNIEFKEFPKLKPNLQQKEAIKKVTEYIEEERPNTFLLHGITGSGKTEIYLQLIEETLNKGKQGIVLVPEIALTPQTVERFYGRFGEGIAVLHSNLSEGERFDEWRRIAKGRARVVIGARSAIFAPFKNLGMIIIDEEHENTYKSEINPKYHVIDVANYRSKEENAVVVLGSATPSMESYYKGKSGKYTLLTLTERATNSNLPDVEVVDMKEELDSGNKGILSRRLFSLIQENLDKGQQTILFLNRRGYSTFVSCRDCGEVIKCRFCDITMTYHKNMKNLQCHYCGERIEEPKICPSCNSTNIRYFGTGTQKIEDLIQKCFPNAAIGRMDMDSTNVKGAHQKILDKFKKGKIHILIGTQMISKGLDFPNVTLVGIIAADAILNLPDFRASEKTFQLATQVAGRAGRGTEKGKVILQTYMPEHYSIDAAAHHNYHRFYNEEIIIRKEFHYPPFTRLININFSGKNLNEVYVVTEKVSNYIKYILNSKGYKDYNNIIFGPNPSIIARINQRYRYQILLKDAEAPYMLLKSIVKYLLIDNREKCIPKSIAAGIDIDPLYIM